VGRHSAPDDVDDGAAEGGTEDVAAVAVAEPARRGRHSVADDKDRDTDTDTNSDADGRAVDSAAVPSTATAVAPPVAGPPAASPSAADLALVRSHADVRARVIAALVVPFAAFTVVMAVLGRLDVSYLTWIWIPLISAGVLVGLLLDLGHKRYPGGTDQPG
jgi:hypothetical protein